MAPARPPVLLPGLIALLATAALLNCTAAQQKTPNTLEREQAVFLFVLYPRIFDGLLVEHVETPIQVRAIFYLGLAQYNAFVNYHPTAVDIFGRAPNRRPRAEHTVENKNIAAIYAIYRVYAGSPASFGGPTGLPTYHEIMRERDLDPSDAHIDGDDPVAIGNRAGFDTLRLILRDGWNAEGLRTGPALPYQRPFQDVSGYAPVNPPTALPFPLRWQPVLRDNGRGSFARQEHVVPHAAAARTFTLSRRQVRRRRVASPYKWRNAPTMRVRSGDKDTLREGARAVLRTSAELTERQRVLAELFDNKLASFRAGANPFGTPSIAGAVRFAVLAPVLDWGLDDDIIYGLAEGLATYDATVVVWKEKVRHDAVRPTGETLAYALGDEEVTAWGGPGRGPVGLHPSQWQSYIGKMPHSEFPSASACLCGVIAEQALLYTGGRDNVPYNVTVAKGSSAVYPGKLPSSDTTITIEKISDWGKLCGKSRLWAGVHFPPAVPAGEKLCRGIAGETQRVVDAMVDGTYKAGWMNEYPGGAQAYWLD